MPDVQDEIKDAFEASFPPCDGEFVLKIDIMRSDLCRLDRGKCCERDDANCSTSFKQNGMCHLSAHLKYLEGLKLTEIVRWYNSQPKPRVDQCLHRICS